MTRLRFLISYDGTDYCGWQRQNQGPKPSLCQTTQEAIEKILNEKISLFASGRTDAGVHAFGQVGHFDTVKPAKTFENWDLAWAIKSKLPASITIKKFWIAPDDFHSTISPTHKTYRYLIHNHQRKSPFLDRYAHWVRDPLDFEYLQKAAERVVGTYDCKSFQSVGTPVASTVRTIYKAEWSWRNKNVLQFSITGSGFLKQMVRNIVGTQLMMERRREKIEKMNEIIDLRDRNKAGPPAPPQGLYLWKVYYPQELDKRCREI
jgi:tRNA pseudouridine38-40 synthase